MGRALFTERFCAMDAPTIEHTAVAATGGDRVSPDRFGLFVGGTAPGSRAMSTVSCVRR